MLPPLEDVGQKDLLLPQGVHPGTMDDIRERFVDTEPKYQRRVDLWARYEVFRTMIRGFIDVQQEYLDGSFVTSRAVPKDLDMSFWVDADAVLALTTQRQAAFAQLWSERIARYSCDAYLVPTCGPGHGAYDEFVFWRDRTAMAWPSYKNRSKVIVAGVAKGYVEVIS